MTTFVEHIVGPRVPYEIFGFLVEEHSGSILEMLLLGQRIGRTLGHPEQIKLRNPIVRTTGPIKAVSRVRILRRLGAILNENRTGHLACKICQNACIKTFHANLIMDKRHAHKRIQRMAHNFEPCIAHHFFNFENGATTLIIRELRTMGVIILCTVMTNFEHFDKLLCHTL